MNNENKKFKSAAELAMEKTDSLLEIDETTEAAETREEGSERKLKTAAEIAMERTKDILDEETAEGPAPEPEKKLKTAKEAAMERADAILKEAENEAEAKKTEEKKELADSPGSLSSLRERLERLKQINLEEGMFQSIGTKKERKKALAEMVSELENEIKAKEAAEKGSAETAALKKENSERLERLRQIDLKEGIFQSVGTEKERQKTLEKMISDLVSKTDGEGKAASKENPKEKKTEVKKAKKGFWSRLFGGS